MRVAVAAGVIALACSSGAPVAVAPSSAEPNVTLTLASSSTVPSATPSRVPLGKERVTFTDPQGLTLVGYQYRPAGPGPFPAIVWNHGSERDPAFEFDAVAAAFVAAGYAMIAPVRQGHTGSQGRYILDVLSETRQRTGLAAANDQLVELMAGPQLDDQLAGLAYLKAQLFVDQRRLAVIGCSYGGIATLLAAERGAGYRAAVAISPAALSWVSTPPLQRRLIAAIDDLQMPAFIIQPANDASLEPARVLGAEAVARQKQVQVKVFPPSGTPALDAHCFGGAAGVKIWAADALAFLASATGMP